ncbi:MAG: ATP synthase F1 subunit delta [Firmicutes bacterium]|nr:ATP synthase F1 subunit delta [Bacillota bacterium]
MVETYKPYAQALFELASEQSKQDEYLDALKELDMVWENAPELAQFLSHPKITTKQKQECLENIFSKDVDPTIYRYLIVLNHHKVIGHFQEIVLAYKELWKEAKNIETVKVESASALEENQIKALKTMLEKKLEKEVELQIKVDESLIAGLRVQTKDFVLDNTVSSRLASMKEQLKG